MLLEAPARKVFPVSPQELGGFPEEVAGQVEEEQGQAQEVEGHGDGARVVEEGHVNPCQKEIDQDLCSPSQFGTPQVLRDNIMVRLSTKVLA